MPLFFSAFERILFLECRNSHFNSCYRWLSDSLTWEMWSFNSVVITWEKSVKRLRITCWWKPSLHGTKPSCRLLSAQFWTKGQRESFYLVSVWSWVKICHHLTLVQSITVEGSGECAWLPSDLEGACSISTLTEWMGSNWLFPATRLSPGHK